MVIIQFYSYPRKVAFVQENNQPISQDKVSLDRPGFFRSKGGALSALRHAFQWKIALGVALAYGIAAIVGLAVTFDHGHVSALWPPAGIAVGALVVFGLRYGAACWLANLAVLLAIHAPLQVAYLVASANTIEYLIAAAALRLWLQSDRRMATVSDVAIFFLVAALAPLVAALTGPWGAAEITPGDDGFWLQALVWWCGDVAGIVLLTPAVLLCGHGLRSDMRAVLPQGAGGELFALLVVGSGLSIIVFGDPLHLGSSAITLAYGVLLILLWGALRLGSMGAALGLIALITPAMLFTSAGYGPFVSEAFLTSVLLLLGFLLIGAALALFLSAALAERNQEAQRSRILSRAVEQSATGVIITDAQGVIRYVNSAFSSVTGYQSDDVIGRTPRFLKSGYTKADEYQRLWEMITNGKTWRGDFLNRRKDGGAVWEHMVISPLRNESGDVTYFVATSEDITARKMNEEQLRQALDSTERARAELERITFAVTHTLQEPLRSIGGFAQLLKKRYATVLDENGLGYVDRVVEGADRMHHLFHDLMHYVMIDEAVPSIDLSLDAVVHSALGSLGDEAKAVTSVGDLPAVKGVERQLVRVFEHLITNALKYRSADRPLQISISLLEKSMGEGQLPINGAFGKSTFGLEQGVVAPQLHICVADNGIGVDPAFVPRLFTLFSRLHTMDRYEGTGVGLAYCRRVIEHHGGTIWMDSAPNQGTMVHFTLPGPVATPGPVVTEGLVQSMENGGSHEDVV